MNDISSNQEEEDKIFPKKKKKKRKKVICYSFEFYLYVFMCVIFFVSLGEKRKDLIVPNCSNQRLIAFTCRSNEIDFSMEICFLLVEWEIEFLPKYNPSCNFIKRKIIYALYVHYIQLSL